jgi:hypothetical protein
MSYVTMPPARNNNRSCIDILQTPFANWCADIQAYEAHDSRAGFKCFITCDITCAYNLYLETTFGMLLAKIRRKDREIDPERLIHEVSFRMA